MNLLTLFLLILCVGMGLMLLRQLRQKTSKTLTSTNTPSMPDNTELTITHVRQGGIIRLNGVGTEFAEFDAEVVGYHTYRCGSSTWHELECERGSSEKIWLELEQDDALELSIGLKKLTLNELGIEKETLITFDDDEEGQFTFDGITYHYEDSDQATFYRHSDFNTPEPFYYWDFESQDGQHYLSIEVWDAKTAKDLSHASKSTIDVTYSQPIRESNITVYRLEAETVSL